MFPPTHEQYPKETPPSQTFVLCSRLGSHYCRKQPVKGFVCTGNVEGNIKDISFR